MAFECKTSYHQFNLVTYYYVCRLHTHIAPKQNIIIVDSKKMKTVRWFFRWQCCIILVDFEHIYCEKGEGFSLLPYYSHASSVVQMCFFFLQVPGCHRAKTRHPPPPLWGFCFSKKVHPPVGHYDLMLPYSNHLAVIQTCYFIVKLSYHVICNWNVSPLQIYSFNLWKCLLYSQTKDNLKW